MNGGGLRFPTGCQQPPARDGPGNSRVRTPASASEGRQQARFSLPVRTRCSSVPLFLRSAPSGVTPPLKPLQERSPSKPTAALSAVKRGVVCSQRNNMHGCYINTNNWLCDILNKNIMSIWMKWQIYSIFFR